MAYVGDGGKRSAPTHTSRRTKPHVRNAPHNVQTPPGGDIASSGGDYGTRKAKQYAASRAGRQAVRKTYVEQGAPRRKQIAAASQHRPGPAAAVVRHEHTSRINANRRAAGLTTPASVIPGLGQVRQQERSQAVINLIQKAHRNTPISTTGDTKSNLELATAESFKATPRYQEDLAAGLAANPRNKQREAPGGLATFSSSLPLADKIIGGAGFLLTKANPALSAFSLTKTLSKTGGENKPGWKNLPVNLAKESLDLPAQAVPSTYHGFVEPLARGDVETAGKNAVQIYSDLYNKPEETITTHPLSSALAVYGPLKGGANIAGSLAKRGGAIPAFRPNAVFPNTPLTEVRPTARGIVKATAQTLKDRPVRRGDKPLPLMSKSAVKRTAHRDRGADEEARRIGRELAVQDARTAIGKKPTAGHILAAQNIVNNMGELRAYHGRIKDRLRANKEQLANKQERAKLSKRDVIDKRRIIATQELTVKSIDDFLAKKHEGKPIDHLPNDADFPAPIRNEIEAYKAVSSHLQDRLGELYGQSPRLEMRRLTPYAIENMGAKFHKSAAFDNETGKILSKDETKQLRKDLPEEEFKTRVSTVSRVFGTSDNRLLTPGEIREHMKQAGSPSRAEPAANAELLRTQQALGRVEDSLRKHYDIKGEIKPEQLKGMDLKKWEEARAEVATAEETVGTARSQREGITEPAYISQAPNRKSAASYFVNTNRPQAISPSGFTGKSIEEGLGSLAKNVPLDDLARAQGLVTAAERFQKMVKDVAVRRDPRLIEDASGEVTQSSEFPEVLTFKNKRGAEAVADDLNQKYPDHRVTPIRIALDISQQKKFLDEANSDEHMGELAQSAIQDALEGKGQDSGTWALMPEDYVGEAAKYLNVNKPIARMFGSQFRRTVLGLSLPWMAGNIGEAALRSAIARSGPRSFYTGKQVLKYLKENDPETWKELQIRTVRGGHYGLQSSSTVHTGVEHLQDASRPVKALVDAVVALNNNKIVGPPARGVGKVWDAWTELVFNKVNSRIEAQFQTAMLGKAVREHLMSDKLLKLSKQAMQEAVDGKLNVRTIDFLGQEVDRMYGKYSKFGPTLRKMVAHETPFIAWYLNAVKFVMVNLPKNHPVVSSLIADAYEATDEWRKDKGLGLFLHGHMPYFLQGSVPREGGNLRLRYTPFSAFDDPLGSMASVFFPQVKSILLNFMGKDWKGDDLKGFDDNQMVGVAAAIGSLTAAIVPGYAHVARYWKEQEGESQAHRIRRAVGDPFLTSKTPTTVKGGGDKKKSYFSPEKGTTGSTSKKKYFSSEGTSKTTKKKKYFTTP